MHYKKPLYKHIWPIDEKAATKPVRWRGWPEDKRFALILKHDVDTLKGHDRCKKIVSLEIERGFHSAFYFVPKRYDVSPQLRHHLVSNGFEVGLHGLYHDGKLFRSRNIFQQRAVEINKYMREWGSVGFSSPSSHRNFEWIHDLTIDYDTSSFDTDPFEPQPDGVGTIFPLMIQGKCEQKGYIELPYTLPQDFTLFCIMKEKGIDIWKKKLDWIASHNGMALLTTHPDYMDFDGKNNCVEEYPVAHYEELLDYVKNTYEGQYWHVLPKEIAQHWLKHYANLT